MLVARVLGPLLKSRFVSSRPVVRRPSMVAQLSVRRPCVVGRPPSIDVGFPRVGRSPEGIALDVRDGPMRPHDPMDEYDDDVLVRHHGYPRNGKQPLPINTLCIINLLVWYLPVACCMLKALSAYVILG